MSAGVLTRARSRRQRGASLVEVLVALVVLSVGMLGVAVMFVQSVRSSRSALFRTQAVNLVSDMADRIRANASAGIAYDMATYGGEPDKQGCAPGDVGEAGENCLVAQLAEDDLARWLEALAETLPAPGEGIAPADVEYIAPVAGGPETYRISIFWLEPGQPPETPFSYVSDITLMPRLAAAAGP